MNILNKYTYLFLGLLAIAGIVILVFLPNLETEEFSQDVIDDIIEGVTTTSTLEVTISNDSTKSNYYNNSHTPDINDIKLVNDSMQ